MHVDLMLCDYAQVHQNKLFVSGAGINLVGTASVAPPHPIRVWLAALITVPWQAHNERHTLRVLLEDADGQPAVAADGLEPGIVAAGEFNVGRGALMEAGESSLLPFAAPLDAVPRLGAYRARVQVDGTPLADASFRVVSISPPVSTGPTAPTDS